jgi:hypothetical protein
MNRLGREQTWSARMIFNGRHLVILMVLAIALAITPSASAWDQTYVYEKWVNPGGIGLSNFNYGVDYNAVWWEPRANDLYQTTLCDASYQCYPYISSDSGFLQDTRSISYGRAKCTAWFVNGEALYVHDCLATN